MGGFEKLTTEYLFQMIQFRYLMKIKKKSLERIPFTQLLKISWDVFKAHPILIIGIIAFTQAPVLLLRNTSFGEQMTFREIVSSGNTSYSFVFNFLVVSFGSIMVSLLTERSIRNKQISAEKIFKKAVSYWWKVIKTKIRLFIFVFALSLVVIIPGLVFSFYWLFASLVVIFNDRTGKEAMDYSKKLVIGNAGYVFSSLIGMYSLAIVSAFILVFPIVFMSSLLGIGTIQSISFNGIQLLLMFFFSLISISTTAMYLRLDEIENR